VGPRRRSIKEIHASHLWVSVSDEGKKGKRRPLSFTIVPKEAERGTKVKAQTGVQWSSITEEEDQGQREARELFDASRNVLHSTMYKDEESMWKKSKRGSTSKGGKDA